MIPVLVARLLLELSFHLESCFALRRLGLGPLPQQFMSLASTGRIMGTKRERVK